MICIEQEHLLKLLDRRCSKNLCPHCLESRQSSFSLELCLEIPPNLDNEFNYLEWDIDQYSSVLVGKPTFENLVLFVMRV